MKDDLISRQAMFETAAEYEKQLREIYGDENELVETVKILKHRLIALPTAQPEPLSDAYMKAVWTWLLNYQIKAAELKGRYTPYEVLSWVANDWRKEHG